MLGYGFEPHQCLWTCLQICGSRRLDYHVGHQEVWHRGGSEESIAENACKWGIHPGFQTQERRDQKSKNRGISGPTKRLMSLIHRSQLSSIWKPRFRLRERPLALGQWERKGEILGFYSFTADFTLNGDKNEGVNRAQKPHNKLYTRDWSLMNQERRSPKTRNLSTSLSVTIFFTSFFSVYLLWYFLECVRDTFPLHLTMYLIVLYL